ncbi:MAG: pyridoxine 5'-phosphate synthase [Acidobacteriota bacterium]
MSGPLLLSVNVDHVATLRQARKAVYPDPVEAARVAEAAGAGGITVHLRGDRRHVQDEDVRRLRPAVSGTLNLEIATEADRLDLAVELRPDQVTLVPERPDEVTTEGGLDVLNAGASNLAAAAARLTEAGIRVSVFLDPDPDQLEALAALERGHVPGFEINTDAYSRAAASGQADRLAAETDKIRRISTRGRELGFRVYAGHGLTTDNVGAIAAVPEIEELNIGHWLVSRAAIVGMAASVREMLDAMEAARPG